MDIIQAVNGTTDIRGYVPSTDSFSSDTTTVQLSTKSCNLQPACTASTSAQNGPACNIYPVDMSYAGNAVGLVTDRCSTNSATTQLSVPCHFHGLMPAPVQQLTVIEGCNARP